MRKLLLAVMQHHKTIFRSGRCGQALARPSAVVSFHGTTPPPAARQVLRSRCCVAPIHENKYTHLNNRKISTAARCVGSDQPDSAAVPADSTDAPAATAAADSSAATEAAPTDSYTAPAPAISASRSSELVQLPGSLKTVWAAFMQQLWDRGFFVDGTAADK